MRLCLVEGDGKPRRSLRAGLRRHGYVVDCLDDEGAALHASSLNHFHAVLLGPALPRGTGLDVLAAMRSRGDRTPVIILSASSGLVDRVAGLDAGADDYLVEPFDVEELAARIRAVHRRREGCAHPERRYGRIALDPTCRTVRYAGAMISLRGREFALLAALMEDPGRVLSREQLLDRVYGWDVEIESNAVEFHIHALRRKLAPTAIRNIRGMGYFLVDEPGL